MANLARWDPFSEFTPLRSIMNRLMEDAWVRPPGIWQHEGMGQFAFDLYETDDELVVTASLPGLRPEDLEITTQGDTLTISGEWKQQEGEPHTYHMQERHRGRVSRQVSLPAHIQADKIQASLEHGVLTLHVPKAEEMKPRRIQVHAGTDTKHQIEPTHEKQAA